MHASYASACPDLMASTSLSAGQLEWLVQHNKHRLSPNLQRINFWTMKSTSAAAATSAAYHRTVYLHLVWMQPCRESRLSILSPCGRGHPCSLCHSEGPLPPRIREVDEAPGKALMGAPRGLLQGWSQRPAPPWGGWDLGEVVEPWSWRRGRVGVEGGGEGGSL